LCRLSGLRRTVGEMLLVVRDLLRILQPVLHALLLGDGRGGGLRELGLPLRQRRRPLRRACRRLLLRLRERRLLGLGSPLRRPLELLGRLLQLAIDHVGGARGGGDLLGRLRRRSGLLRRVLRLVGGLGGALGRLLLRLGRLLRAAGELAGRLAGGLRRLLRLLGVAGGVAVVAALRAGGWAGLRGALGLLGVRRALLGGGLGFGGGLLRLARRGRRRLGGALGLAGARVGLPRQLRHLLRGLRGGLAGLGVGLVVLRVLRRPHGPCRLLRLLLRLVQELFPRLRRLLGRGRPRRPSPRVVGAVVQLAHRLVELLRRTASAPRWPGAGWAGAGPWRCCSGDRRPAVGRGLLKLGAVLAGERVDLAVERLLPLPPAPRPARGAR
jgi:hypothetical protein